MSPRRKRRHKKPLPLEESLLARYAHAGLLADEVPVRLDASLKAEMESLFGVGLEGVRLHVGERAQKMAEALGARAFALGGGDVFFARGEFAPNSPEGKALLAHELTHVAENMVALHRRSGKPEREELEGRARRVEEFVLAKEETMKQLEPEPAEPADVELPSTKEPEPQVATIDKAALEDKVYELMERELRRERERTGRI